MYGKICPVFSKKIFTKRCISVGAGNMDGSCIFRVESVSNTGSLILWQRGVLDPDTALILSQDGVSDMLVVLGLLSHMRTVRTAIGS
jgi:hypothetical protein